MNYFESTKQIIADILDVEEVDVSPGTYLIRDLGAESIDLLELAVSFNAEFKIQITDDDLFLRKLRIYLDEAKDSRQEPLAYLAGKYPFLRKSRLHEMLEELPAGPVLKVEDLVSYISYHSLKLED